MNKVQHVKWCMKQTKLTSEISCPTDFCLAQLVEHKSDDQEVMSSNPLGRIFDEIFFCSSRHGDMSDNLTETCIVKNPKDALLIHKLISTAGHLTRIPWIHYRH